MSDVGASDEEFFDYGDLVYAKINPNITGMVVGDSDFGRFVRVRLQATMTVAEFQYFELAHVFEDEGGGGDNVVRVDFTKGKISDPDQGAA